jgi:hypothetical protein
VRVTARRSGGRRLFPLVLAGALAAACAAPRASAPPPAPAPAPASPPAPAAQPPPPAPPPSRADLVVLLPAPDGKVGTVVVQEGGREIVLDTAYASARTGAGGRMEAGQATPGEVRALFADALTAVPPRPVAFVLHFVGGTDQLTPASQALVDQILATIATRPAPDLTVAGHTDSVGTDQRSSSAPLAQRRPRRAERTVRRPGTGLRSARRLGRDPRRDGLAAELRPHRRLPRWGAKTATRSKSARVASRHVNSVPSVVAGIVGSRRAQKTYQRW